MPTVTPRGSIENPSLSTWFGPILRIEHAADDHVAQAAPAAVAGVVGFGGLAEVCRPTGKRQSRQPQAAQPRHADGRQGLEERHAAPSAGKGAPVSAGCGVRDSHVPGPAVRRCGRSPGIRAGLGSDCRAAVLYVTYLGKTFWPENLAAMYPGPPMEGAWPALGAGVLLVLLTAGAVWGRGRGQRWLAVGWFWYLGPCCRRSVWSRSACR